MDHLTEEAALTAWQRTDRCIRLSAARVRLDALGKVASLMRHNDRIDAARGIWLLFIDGQDQRHLAKLAPHEVVAEAAVLAGVAWHLGERDIVGFARGAWGDRSIVAHCAADTHLGWYPDDNTVIISRRTPNGTTTVLQMSPGGVSGRVL